MKQITQVPASNDAYAIARKQKDGSWTVDIPGTYFDKGDKLERVVVNTYSGDGAAQKAIDTAANMAMAFSHGIKARTAAPNA